MALICLQGGDELTPACRPMDALLLDRAGGGPVVVLPAASAPGHEYATTGRNGVRHFTDLGATGMTVAPDPRDDAAGACHAVRRARLLVLPGGSPRRLRDTLFASSLHEAVREVAAGDGVVVGASAGAMLLCGLTVLPESHPEVADGLGLVPDFAVLPHHRPGHHADWVEALRARDPDLDLLGIPERSGVLLDGPDVVAVGEAATTLLAPDGPVELSLGG